MRINAPFQSPAHEITEEEILAYIQKYLSVARFMPGLLGYTWVQLQLHFPLDQIERLKGKAT